MGWGREKQALLFSSERKMRTKKRKVIAHHGEPWSLHAWGCRSACMKTKIRLACQCCEVCEFPEMVACHGLLQHPIYAGSLKHVCRNCCVVGHTESELVSIKNNLWPNPKLFRPRASGIFQAPKGRLKKLAVPESFLPCLVLIPIY